MELYTARILPKSPLLRLRSLYAVVCLLMTGAMLLLINGNMERHSLDKCKDTPINVAVDFKVGFPSKFQRKSAGLQKHIGKLDEKYQVFTVNDKPVIWAFWDDVNIPALLRLSLASVKCHNSKDFEFQVLQMRSISNWIDHIHPAFPYLIPAHKADYFRARILDEYGGIYVDADSIGKKIERHQKYTRKTSAG